MTTAGKNCLLGGGRFPANAIRASSGMVGSHLHKEIPNCRFFLMSATRDFRLFLLSVGPSSTIVCSNRMRHGWSHSLSLWLPAQTFHEMWSQVRGHGRTGVAQLLCPRPGLRVPVTQPCSSSSRFLVTSDQTSPFISPSDVYFLLLLGLLTTHCTSSFTRIVPGLSF